MIKGNTRGKRKVDLSSMAFRQMRESDGVIVCLAMIVQQTVLDLKMMIKHGWMTRDGEVVKLPTYAEAEAATGLSRGMIMEGQDYESAACLVRSVEGQMLCDLLNDLVGREWLSPSWMLRRACWLLDTGEGDTDTIVLAMRRDKAAEDGMRRREGQTNL